MGLIVVFVPTEKMFVGVYSSAKADARGMTMPAARLKSSTRRKLSAAMVIVLNLVLVM